MSNVLNYVRRNRDFFTGERCTKDVLATRPKIIQNEILHVAIGHPYILQCALVSGVTKTSISDTMPDMKSS